MDKAREFAKSEGYDRLELSTATDNFIGQSLYESLGYERDNDFYHYSLEIDNERLSIFYFRPEFKLSRVHFIYTMFSSN